MRRFVCLYWDVGFVVSDMIPPPGNNLLLFPGYSAFCGYGGIVPYEGFSIDGTNGLTLLFMNSIFVRVVDTCNAKSRITLLRGDSI